MDVPTVIVTAIVAGATSAGAALAVSKYQEIQNLKHKQEEIEIAFRNGHMQGWHEGQDAVMNRFGRDVQPQDFSQVP